MRLFMLISLLLLPNANVHSDPPAEPATLRVVIPDIASAFNISPEDFLNHEDYYFSKLLELALSKTEETYSPFSIQLAPKRATEHRFLASVLKGEVDVFWGTLDPDIEKYLQPIRISLLKDLSSYRVLMIRRGDQARFSAIKNLDDLRKLRGGMHPQWSDAAIMAHNGLPLVFGTEYTQLFFMLAAGRFDYFSRGLAQIYIEPYRFPDLPLAIEEELLLHYRNDFYFIVRKEDTKLAERLTEGLKRAQGDGSFDALFNSVQRYRWGMEQLEQNKRRVITLKNLPSGFVHMTKPPLVP
jgi:hypothetical protein